MTNEAEAVLGEQARRLHEDSASVGRSMVQWYHAILTAYGFWLPNDPRGSWSEFVGAWELYWYGAATTTTEKRSLARDPHDARLRRVTKTALKYPCVRFDARQRELVGAGFAQAVEEGGHVVYACCIGHDHAHLVVARHARRIENVARHLKSKSTMALTRAGLHPLASHRKPDGSVPTPWSEGIWSVFINDDTQLDAAIAYVHRHPMKEGLAEQRWACVTPKNGA